MDSDDKLLREGKGVNNNHEIKILSRLFGKPFLPSFNYDNTPKQKYHYTSSEGLMGILKTRTFYFTDSQFLNDFRERININEELELFWRDNRKKYDKEFFKLLSSFRVDKYEDTGFSYADSLSSEMCRYFVFSMSMEKDCLSMWKYYSKNNSYDGYCIKLFSAALVDEWIDRTTGVAIISSKIEYYSEEKQKLISETVDRLFEIWKSYELSDELNDKIKKEYSSWVSVEALFFKNQCFEDERETRYVAIVPTNKLNDLYYEYDSVKHKMYDFRIVNGVLTPYIKMPFNDWNKETCWAISSIRIGPSANSEQRLKGLERFIDSLDYKFESCPLLQSEIPVRY
jgi:hypothetical protein